LPNILKEFNPGLKGYSVGKGEFLAPNSHMNVAFPVSADYDAYRQAQFLVKKMRKDPDVDFKNDWKVRRPSPSLPPEPPFTRAYAYAVQKADVGFGFDEPYPSLKPSAKLNKYRI